MFSEADKKRIYWGSRRGMLELDLMLVPFFEACFDTLTVEDQQCYVRLLESEDTHLFAWLLGHETPDDPAIGGMVNRIQAFARDAAS